MTNLERIVANFNNNDIRKSNEYTDEASKAYEFLKINENVTFEKRKELELAISKDTLTSYHYAKNVLKGRFELGELAISKVDEYSYFYAKNVLKSRFELGELAISYCPKYSYLYALDVLKGRFELGELAISFNSIQSCNYAKNILKY